MPLTENRITILLIVENDSDRAAIANHLAAQHWVVAEAATGRDGLALIKNSPRLIIVEEKLADMSGKDLRTLLRAGAATQHLPVLILKPAEALNENAPSDPASADQHELFLTQPVDAKELIATIKGVLRLRLAEAKLENSLARLELVIDSMIEGVITVDREGNFTSMNPAALKIYGFSQADEMPPEIDAQEPLIERTRLDGSPLPRAEWPIFRALKGEVVRGCELRIVRKDTGKVWIGSFNATPLRNLGSGGDAVILTVFDITARKADEAALREAQAKLKNYADELEQKVADRTASLREAISQMEEFSYTVSHDLRAPLRSIKGYAEVLVHDHSAKLKGDAARFLERIIENGNRMERLVNDVLTISRISSTKLRLEPVDLNPLLQSIILEYPNLNASVAKITIEPLPVVIGHESLCTQVFANLLSNAAKFVPTGTMPLISVWAQPFDHLVRINVKDNGIGIGPEFHQKIFGMFERLDPENHYSGTGIGLAIVRRAMEKMNGRVGVESDGHSGSLFWIELPRAS